MSALTDNRDTKQLAGLATWPSEFTVYNDAVLYAGAMLAIDTTPELRPAADTSGFKVVGRCPQKLDNADDGKKSNAELGVFLWDNDESNPVVVGDVICYVKYDNCVCASAGSSNHVVAGLVVEVTSAGVWVDQTEVGLKVARAIYASGLYTQQAHVADVASVTQDTLTDNGGGTADGTVASQAAPTTLTDNTGGSGTHDDTLAAVTTPTNVTDNSGGSTADTTIAAITNSANAGSADVAVTAAAVAKLAVLANAAGTAIGVLKQNQSDLAQKVIEIVTLLGTAQNNLKEITTELAKIKTDNAAQVTKINAILAALESAGVLAAS